MPTKKKSGIEFEDDTYSPKDYVVVPDATLKAQLRELFEHRPMFNGREYSNLHKWYAELEKLL